VTERTRVENERLIRELAGLVRHRDALRARGAGKDELESTRREIERLRWRLANVVRRDSLADGPQAA